MPFLKCAGFVHLKRGDLLAIRIKGLSKAVRNIEKKLKGAKINKAAQSHICNLIEEDTKETIRKGRNPKTKTSAAIKQLKPSSVRNRRYRARYNTTHPNYNPNKSNLTLTGELIDSIKCRFKKLRRGVGFTLQALGKHKKYKTKKGRSKAKRVSNSDIIAAQKALGRDVLGIRGPVKKKIVQILKELYIDVLK